MHPYHQQILDQIIQKSGKATQHTFLDRYLGNSHPRYAINTPSLRAVAKSWMREHQSELSVKEFCLLISSLIEGESSTEKIAGTMLLDYAPRSLWQFDPSFFDQWLSHLQGWAEVDALCTGAYSASAIPENFTKWKKLLVTFSKNKMIEKRRASLVLLCSPLSKVNDTSLLEIAFKNINLLKSEKEILITKAISWVLRSAIKHYKKEVALFVKQNSDSLPKIAVRETLMKLKTGKKTKSKEN